MKTHELVLTRNPDDSADLIGHIEAALNLASRGGSPFIYTSNCIMDEEASFFVVGDKRPMNAIVKRLNAELGLEGRLDWGM
ncbi:MAG: hypothetical protein FJW31_10295 [Acidobacteria bacterium]|nr:hypothetical protein [Acidobacteriota bacterium]